MKILLKVRVNSSHELRQRTFLFQMDFAFLDSIFSDIHKFWSCDFSLWHYIIQQPCLFWNYCWLGAYVNISNTSYFSLKKCIKPHFFHPKLLLKCNLSVKQLGSQMRLSSHILWGLIWIRTVCKVHKWTSKLTASRKIVKGVEYIACYATIACIRIKKKLFVSV